MEFILIAITLGFLGSFHCLGMCGPIALALPIGKAKGFKRFFLIALYNKGRIISYGAMGVVAGLVGKGIVLAGYQQMLSVGVGVMLILAVIFQTIYNPLKHAGTKFYSFFNSVKNRLSIFFTKRGYRSLFTIGLLNGLLPCGLVYMALAGAIGTGSVINAVLFMMIFGAGTLPMMMFLPYAGNLISIHARNTMRKAVPIVILCMAVLLVLRGLNLGIPYLSPRVEADEKVACCHHSAGNNNKAIIRCTGQNSQQNR